MPRKSILIGGAVAILLALTLYLVTMPEAAKPAPVSREEFVQDMESFDFSGLTGSEREEAISHLRSLAENMAPGRGGGFRGPRRGRGESGSGMRSAMESLQPEERRQIMEPTFRRFGEEREKQMEEFFEKTPEEQNAELDRMVDRMERMEERRQERATDTARRGGEQRTSSAQRGQGRSGEQRTDRGRSDRGRGWRGRRTPDERRERSLARLVRGNSTSRARRTEFMRRLAERAGQRKRAARTAAGRAAAAARARQRKKEQEEREKKRAQQKPVTEEVVVQQPAEGLLWKLKVGDPITIANLAEADMPPQVVVARAGKQVGELPPSKCTEYADYMTERRSIWAKVLEVDPARDYLLIEVNVK